MPAPTDADVAIVGGGIAGLACATALASLGLRVVVLEAGDALGGRARSWRDGATSDVVDTGPHILLSEYRNLLALLERLGTRGQITWNRERFTTLVDGGRQTAVRLARLPAPLHLLPSLLRIPSLSWGDLLSNLRVTWRALRLDRRDMLALDAVDARSFLRASGVSARMIEWFWASACIAILGVRLEQCSAGALLRFYQQMVGYDGYAVGFAGVGLAELFAQQSCAAVQRAGGAVLLDTAVAGITVQDGKATGVELRDGQRVRARFCVAAVPPTALGTLVPAPWQEADGALRAAARFAPRPYISSYLWFDRKLTQQPFWARVWTNGTLNTDFYDLSNIRPALRGAPSLIATNIICSERAAGLDDDAVIAATLREIAQFAPNAAHARLRHARVHRIPMAIPCPAPGTERLRPGTRTAIPGLLLAGDWLQTGLPASMESAARAGHLAADAIALELGVRTAFALPLRPLRGLARVVQRLPRLTATAARRPAARPC
jgi:15-cis-phytoene desaturase